jgi:nucleoside-diphosphate-sugar epimerase
MRVTVTGGAGYVGSTLVPLLLGAGHSVRVVDVLLHGGESLLGVWGHPRFEFVGGDLRDAAAREAAVEAADALVHLAAIVGDPACARAPDVAASVNVEASMALLDATCRARGTRFIFASTCSNYGRMADPAAFVSEESPLRPVSLYAQTKVAVEQAVLTAGRTGACCATALRFATVYGASPRMRFDLTVNEFTAEALARRRLVVYGEQFWRPYVHVRDAARAVALVLAAPPELVAGQVYNVGSTKENYRKLDIVELLRPVAPDAVIEYVPQGDDPRDYRVSFQRIADSLGYAITRRVADGIAEVAGMVQAGIVADFTDPRYRN